MNRDPCSKWAGTGERGRFMRDVAKIERAYVSLSASIGELNWSMQAFMAAWLTAEALNKAAADEQERKAK